MKIRNSGMEIFKGKTLLLLGSNVASSDIVQYVNAQGGRTIVTDFYPREKSKAKGNTFMWNIMYRPIFLHICQRE